MIKTEFYYQTMPGGPENTYRVTWYKVENDGPAVELCHGSATVTGNAENVERALAYVASEIRRKNAELFRVEPDPMDEGMLREAMDVHN